MSEDISIAVSTDEAAERLKQNFEELLVRVNSDMMFQSMKPDDPVSVEAAIAAAERSIDSHLAEFPEDAALQSLRADLKLRYRGAIQQQAQIAARV
jgi:hypothetical protein